MKPSCASEDLKITNIAAELVKYHSLKKRKKKQQHHLTDFSKQSESVKISVLKDSQKYRIRTCYKHSLEMIGEFGEWKEFSTKPKFGVKGTINIFVCVS